MNMFVNRTSILRYVVASPMALALVLAANQAAAQSNGAGTQADTTPSQVADAASPQSGTSALSGGIEEVTVTARKVSENLQKVPVSVTALNSDQLKLNNTTRLSDLSGTVPGLLIKPGVSPVDTPSFTIRGQQQDNALATVDPSVGVYVDGVYWARMYGLNSDMLDVKDIQVLRGPQGTLFGRNTTGGAILIETNNPDLSKFSADVDGSYGNYNYLQGTAILNVPIVVDQLAARFAIQRTKQDGYQPLLNDPSVRNGSQNSLSVKGKLLWQVNDDLSILLSGQYYWADFNLPNFNLGFYPSTSNAAFEAGFETEGAACFADEAACVEKGNTLLQSGIQKYLHSDTAYSLIPNHQKEKTQTYGATVTYETGFGEAKLISGYRRIDMDSIDNYGGAPYVLAYFNAYQHLYQWSLEGQLTGTALNDRLKFAGGLFYFNESGIDASLFQAFADLSALAGIGDVQYLGHINNTSIGVYGQASYSITDKLTLTEGLRWSQDKKGVVVNNGLWSGGTIGEPAGTFTCTSFPSGCGGLQATKDANISYLADLAYQFTPDIMGYVKTARGYRSGGTNLREVDFVANFNPNTFLPEQATEYEVGVKSQFWDDRARLNVDGFYTIVKNLQRMYIVSNGESLAATFEGNAGEGDFAGMEAELQLKLLAENDQDFIVNLGASNTSTWYVSYFNPVSGFDQSHEKFPNVARWQLNVGGTYDHTFDIGVLTLHANYSWQSGYAMAGNNYYVVNGIAYDASSGAPYASIADAEGFVKSLQAPAGGILDLRASLSLADERYDIALWGRNVLNNRSFIAEANIPGYFTSDSPHAPAMYGFTVSAHF